MRALCAPMTSEDAVKSIPTDDVIFPVVQVALLLFIVVIFIFDIIRNFRKPKSGYDAIVTRGPTSMAMFYATYGILTGIFISLSLTVNFAENHRTFFVLFDAIFIAYACLWNAWFRERLIKWTGTLARREH